MRLNTAKNTKELRDVLSSLNKKVRLEKYFKKYKKRGIKKLEALY